MGWSSKYMVIMGIHEASFLTKGQLLGGSCHLGYVVNNHGDHNSPKDRVVRDPFQMAFHFMAYKWGES